MSIWDRRTAHQLRRESEDLRDQLLLAAAKLDVFVAALRVEVEQTEDGGPGDGGERTTPQR